MAGEEQIRVSFEVIAGDDNCSFSLRVTAEEPFSYDEFLDALAAFLSEETGGLSAEDSTAH